MKLEKIKKETLRQESQKKKDKDKEDREKQKQLQLDRKEKEKKRTQKGEKKRWYNTEQYDTIQYNKSDDKSMEDTDRLELISAIANRIAQLQIELTPTLTCENKN